MTDNIEQLYNDIIAQDSEFYPTLSKMWVEKQITKEQGASLFQFRLSKCKDLDELATESVKMNQSISLLLNK